LVFTAILPAAADERKHFLRYTHCFSTFLYLANVWFIGSGVIEAGCKTVIGRRLKQSGMFWSEPGAEHILSLRCLVLGPHFDAAWMTRRALLTRQQAKARRWHPDQ